MVAAEDHHGDQVVIAVYHDGDDRPDDETDHMGDHGHYGRDRIDANPLHTNRDKERLSDVVHN